MSDTPTKILHQCKKHGETQGYHATAGYSRCRLCADEAQARYRKKHRKTIIAVESAIAKGSANDAVIAPPPPEKRFRKPVYIHDWYGDNYDE